MDIQAAGVGVGMGDASDAYVSILVISLTTYWSSPASLAVFEILIQIMEGKCQCIRISF